MPIIKKEAEDFLPQDLQDAINSFIQQFNIMEQFDLDYIPTEYTTNLIETMSKYPEYNNTLLGLLDIINEYSKKG